MEPRGHLPGPRHPWLPVQPNFQLFFDPILADDGAVVLGFQVVNDLCAVSSRERPVGATILARHRLAIPMTQLVFHIGSPKTGTTSIQRYLARNEAELLASNWSVLKCRWGGLGLTVEKLELDTLFAQKPKADAYLYSDEGIFGQICDTDQIRKLKDIAGRHVDRVTVVVYLRRQDSFGVSLKQQQVNLPRIIPGTSLGTSPSALPDLDDENVLRFDFFSLISRWGDVFGDQNVVIRVYDPDELHGGDVVSDFLRINGIPEFDRPKEVSNPSRGREASLVGFAMLSLSIPQPIRDVISQSLDDSEKLMASAEECREFYAKFREGNRRLNERFKVNDRPCIFSEDFDMYPQEGNSTWDDETATRAIHNILKGLKRLNHLDAENARTLCEAAERLAETDAKLARKISLLAQKIDPDDPNIRARVHALKAKAKP